jgi:UDP-glucose 4-epimerase
MSKILITGAHGFIGKHLVQWLTQHGHQVSGIGHGNWSAEDAKSRGISCWFNGHIHSDNLSAVQKEFGTPDIVYHLAGGSSVGVAMANPKEDFYRTASTTAELLEWMRTAAPECSLVAISSAAVYGSGHAGQISEDDRLAPYSPYGYHKRVMEDLCRSYAENYDLRVCIPRLFSVFGTELKKQLLWDLCSRISSGVTPIILGGSGKELRDWTDVRDVVRALDMLAHHASTDAPVFNIGTGKASSVFEIASSVINHWPVLNPDNMLRFSGQSRPGDPFSLISDSKRLARLGFTWNISVEQGLETYVRWYQHHLKPG